MNVHELIKLHHHATVFTLGAVLLLIGDQKDIIRGVWVKFDVEIIESYERILMKSYKLSIKWLYDSREQAMVNADIEPLSPIRVDIGSFKDMLELWRTAFMYKERRLPIAPTTHIIPLHFSVWNKTKGKVSISSTLSY